MNKDIREVIDNIKKFNQFTNENKQQILTPESYLEDFYVIDFNEETYNKEQSLEIIQETIDYVLNIKYPLKVYRGINTIKPDEVYADASWTTDIRVAEGFGDKIYVGLIPNKSAIEIEQTIRTRVMNPFEYEIYVPNFNNMKIIDTYEKKSR